jgi:hypothetical protein
MSASRRPFSPPRETGHPGTTLHPRARAWRQSGALGAIILVAIGTSVALGITISSTARPSLPSHIDISPAAQVRPNPTTTAVPPLGSTTTAPTAVAVTTVAGRSTTSPSSVPTTSAATDRTTVVQVFPTVRVEDERGRQIRDEGAEVRNGTGSHEPSSDS